MSDNDSPFADADPVVGVDWGAGDPTSEWVWRTKDGQYIALRDMGDDHLLNTIRVLRGRSPKGTTIRVHPVGRRLWLNAMANEAYRRGLTIEAQDEDDPIHE